MWAPSVAPRDVVDVVRCLGLARKMLRHRPAMVIEHRIGIALGFLPLLAAGGVSTHYVESATRAVGPSLTGRILGKVPPVNVYTSTSSGRAPAGPTPGRCSTASPPCPAHAERISKVVVTVGSLKFPFERMLERVADLTHATPRCCGRWGPPTCAASTSRPAAPYRPTSWPRPSARPTW